MGREIRSVLVAPASFLSLTQFAHDSNISSRNLIDNAERLQYLPHEGLALVLVATRLFLWWKRTKNICRESHTTARDTVSTQGAL